MCEKEDVAKIRYLYFYRFYSYEKLEKHFKGKYTYSQLKKIIKEILDEY
jgi:hypothetical protein